MVLMLCKVVPTKVTELTKRLAELSPVRFRGCHCILIPRFENIVKGV